MAPNDSITWFNGFAVVFMVLGLVGVFPALFAERIDGVMCAIGLLTVGLLFKVCDLLVRILRRHS